jgi:hypothetical protein
MTYEKMTSVLLLLSSKAFSLPQSIAYFAIVPTHYIPSHNCYDFYHDRFVTCCGTSEKWKNMFMPD